MARQTTFGKLPELKIRNAKGKSRPYKLADGGGLYLLVNPDGSKYWRLKYRIDGKEKTLSLGVYPVVTVAMAREEALEAKRQIRRGDDPIQVRRLEKQLRATNTFYAIAQEWYEKQKGRWTPDHANRVWISLEQDVFPILGSRSIGSIKPLDCLSVVRSVEERGALDVAGRVKQRMSGVFRYAIQTARLDHNPADQLKDVIATRKVVHRAALTAEALPGFLKALDAYTGHELTRLALNLLILTFVRPGELCAARWDEMHLRAKQWRIPAERMKMREEHIVPLSRQAVEILKELKRFTGHYDLIFPGVRNVRRPMSENTLTFAIRKRMGFNATAHGFRSTASTILNEAGFRPDVIERQLAHAERNKVRAAYNRSQYLVERAEMMQWWADYLDDRRTGEKVVPIHRRRG